MQFFIIKENDRFGLIPVTAYYRSDLELGAYWDANGLFFYLLELDHIGHHPFDGFFASSFGVRLAAWGKMLYFVDQLGLKERCPRGAVNTIVKQITNTLKEINEDGLMLSLKCKLTPQAIKNNKIEQIQNRVFNFLARYEDYDLDISKSQLLGNLIRPLCWGYNQAAFNYPKNREGGELVTEVYDKLKEFVTLPLSKFYKEGVATVIIEHGCEQDFPFLQAAFEL